ncbi:quaternary ammonium compound efflux SMR transporter SugE2 [Bacillus carboniphilus]|uniref:Quaternary ammonium compound efflux SMR transporter SugE2 n=1 Tax=Bacillus carboniphilus TaxID=86663 RepID=A0ABP3FPZ3_9BACI
MAWVWLILAGFGEVAFVIFMKLSNGFKKISYTVFTVLAGAFSFYFLSRALITIPLGTGYAIWTGIGAAGSVVLGMLFFNESKDIKRILFLSLIVISVVGLKVVG